MSSLEEALGTASASALTEDYQPSSVGCEFITGAAGTGKTFTQKKLIEENQKYGLLCATTGIAAINLGATTLNSVLKFFDTDSLRDRFNRGGLTSTLHRIGRTIKKLVIDEVSMMDARQLDYIYQAMFLVNEFQDMEGKPMGITLTGDFCQLPPIKSPWAFEADCWEHFERRTTKLTKVYRQDNADFLAAINFARSGEGAQCVNALQSLGVRFIHQQEGRFKGTTIMSKNDQVDNFNFSALMDVPGTAFGLNRAAWGDQAGEWKNIPETLKLKEGAYVMILANDHSGMFEYANGDCGTIQSKDINGTIWIKLKRNEKLVGIQPITRYKSANEEDAELSLKKQFPSEYLEQKNPFDPEKLDHLYCDKDCGASDPGIRYGSWGRPSYNCQSGSINIGAVKFYPLRLAWATTVHKCVHEDTLVPVSGLGLIPIKDTRVGHQTPYGEIIGRGYSKRPALRITTRRGYSVVASPEHRWMTLEGLKEGQQLRPGDQIEMARVPHLEGQEMPPELAWFLGVMVGDGSYADEKEGQLHFTNSCESLRQEFIKIVESRGYHASERSDKRGCHATSKPHRQELLELGLGYVTGRDKEVPSAVLEGNSDVWANFLGGLFDADGSISKSRICLTTVSKKVAEQVGLMLLYLGIPSKTSEFNTGYRGRGETYFQIGIAPAFGKLFVREINLRHPDKQQKAQEVIAHKPNRSLKRFDGFDEILRVIPEGEAAMVDVEINSSRHLYAFGPFVGHNSQGLTLDTCQIDCRDQFFGQPSMAYVSLSRCRTPEGLQIVGTPEKLAERIVLDPKVRRWL